MKQEIEILRAYREKFLGLINEYSVAQLNQIPDGFSNNLIWNFGHNVVTLQILAYTLSNNTPVLDQALIDKYRKGSKPDGKASAEEIELLKEASLETITQFEEDYRKGIFSKFNEYPTSMGIVLTNVEQGFVYNLAHEANHYGIALAIKKLIK